jgi:hypothetical protein
MNPRVQASLEGLPQVECCWHDPVANAPGTVLSGSLRHFWVIATNQKHLEELR